MKKTILIGLLLLTTKCYAGLFGIDGSLFKQETQNIKNELSAIKEMNLNNNMELGTIKSSIGQLQLQIGQVNTNLKATAFDNSKDNSIKSGRDTTTSTTNDSELMRFIFDKIIYVIGLIIGLIGTLIASYERLLKQKDRWISDVEKRNSEKQDKLDLWQNQFIEKLVIKKEEL